MKQEFKIEKGVPLSRTGSGRPKGTKYPWDKMEVGDRVEIPVSDGVSVKNKRSAIATSARQWAAYNGKPHVFATRIIDDRLYVWRTA